MHTRKDARHAGLDTHVLKWLRDLGYDAPKATPSKKQYLAFEKVFVDIADILSMPIATLDLAIWNAYSTGGSYEIDSSYIPKLPDYKRAA
jgi:thermostable 8-oxoguanine DNA glycosylase